MFCGHNVLCVLTFHFFSMCMLVHQLLMIKQTILERNISTFKNKLIGQ